MKQNEQIKDNGFENFEEQGKYKSIAEQRRKREKIANKVAGIAIVFFLLGIAIVCMEMEWLTTCVFDTSIGYIVKRRDMIFVGYYACADIFSVVAIAIRKTKFTKRVFIFLVIFPIVSVLSVFAGYLLLYIAFYPLFQFAWSSM